MVAGRDTRYVIDKLGWMRAEGIWPNGLRYLWTDAFGVVLLVSLYTELDERRYLDQAESLVEEVDRVLGRPRGIRIGEAPDRDGQFPCDGPQLAFSGLSHSELWPGLPGPISSRGGCLVVSSELPLHINGAHNPRCAHRR
ncbi:MAG: hypothetical protein ACMG6H_03460 [Acidobacteriota bacterium]